MGERKVLNKYYPPDFDPAKLPRRRQPKNKQTTVRMMLPMSIQCKTCGTYIYKGTKFNSRKEDVIGESWQTSYEQSVKLQHSSSMCRKTILLTYLGIQIFRFYFKCTRCSSELTMKTDPKNSDYVVESGATRNYEPWRAEDEKEDNEKRKRESEEKGDAMKSLENRTLESKREMDIIAALDEMKSMKSRHACVSSDELLEVLKRTREEKEKERIAQEEAQDEALIKSIFQGPKPVIYRINDDDIDEEDDLPHIKDDDETTNYGNKRRKVSTDLGNPTDSLTKQSVSYISKDRAPEKDAASKNSKFIFKSASVKVAVVKKKPAPTALAENSVKEEKKERESAIVSVVKKPVPSLGEGFSAKERRENESINDTNTALHVLGQNYDSDED